MYKGTTDFTATVTAIFSKFSGITLCQAGSSKVFTGNRSFLY